MKKKLTNLISIWLVPLVFSTALGLGILGVVSTLTQEVETPKVVAPVATSTVATVTPIVIEQKATPVNESKRKQTVVEKPTPVVVQPTTSAPVAQQPQAQPQQQTVVIQYVPVYVPQQTQTQTITQSTTTMEEETPAPKVAAVPYQDPVIVFKVNGQAVEGTYQASHTDETVLSWEATGQEALRCTLNDVDVDQFGSKSGIVTEPATYTLKCRGVATNSRVEKTIVLN